MNTILFISEKSPIPPAIAAACLRSMNVGSVRGQAAAGREEQPDEDLQRILAETGLAWPEEIISSSSISWFSYDLVVCFAHNSDPVLPPLPGNPAVLYWNVPVPASSRRSDPDAWRLLRDRIRGLVHDLLEQGYLSALVQAEKNAELVMDNLHEGIIAHDMNRTIFFFNRAAERITGYSRKEILGRDCHNVFPGGFCAKSCSFCDPDSGTELPDRPYPLVFKTPSGESRQVEMSIVLIRDKNDVAVGIVGSFRDMTRELELAGRLGEIERFSGIIGRDPAMLEIFETVRHLADSNVPVHIQGESGTGKELVAVAIHNEGNRARKRFVAVNCGALPENLLESELFGHVKGAFTGAIRDKKGLFELADQGTIFLDEIGDITPAMQVKLLRVLQDGTFQRVGGEETVTVNVRVISATHRDLQQEIAAGRFREDLYYRLCVMQLRLPPLRERRNDIPLLAHHFLKRFLAEEKRSEIMLANDTLDILMSYDWPGNVRELENSIRHLLVRCREKIAQPQHLPPEILRKHSRPVQVAARGKRRKKLEIKAVRRAIAETGNNRVRAAKLLGVSRATLYRFLAEHPLD